MSANLNELGHWLIRFNRKHSKVTKEIIGIFCLILKENLIFLIREFIRSNAIKK